MAHTTGVHVDRTGWGRGAILGLGRSASAAPFALALLAGAGGWVPALATGGAAGAGGTARPPDLGFKPAVLAPAAAQPNLASGGGPIQTAPHVYVVYWAWHGKDPSGVRPYLEAFLSGVGGSLWLNSVTQYCQGVAKGATTCPASAVHAGNPAGVLKGTWADDVDPAPSPNPNPALPGRPQLWTEVGLAAKHFGIDTTDVNNVIVIVYPHGMEIPDVACAFHEEPGAFSPPVPFITLSYTPDYGTNCGRNSVNKGAAGLLDGVSITAGHELAETITDPTTGVSAGFGWIDKAGQENGDKCAWMTGANAPIDVTLSTGTFAVQPLWSNAANRGAGGCVTTYGSVAPTPTPTPVPTPAPVAPGPPTAVVAQPTGGGSATVSWTPPVANGGAPVAGYAVYGFSYTGTPVLLETSNPTSSVASGLAAGGYYTFTVTAWNGQWSAWSAWSPWVVAT